MVATLSSQLLLCRNLRLCTNLIALNCPWFWCDLSRYCISSHCHFGITQCIQITPGEVPRSLLPAKGTGFQGLRGCRLPGTALKYIYHQIDERKSDGVASCHGNLFRWGMELLSSCLGNGERFLMLLVLDVASSHEASFYPCIFFRSRFWSKFLFVSRE